MGHQNRYCTRCGRTTAFRVEGRLFTCMHCGVQVEQGARNKSERILVGDPFRFRTRFW